MRTTGAAKDLAWADFVFRQYNPAGLSHYFYLIGIGGKAIVFGKVRAVIRA